MEDDQNRRATDKGGTGMLRKSDVIEELTTDKIVRAISPGWLAGMIAVGIINAAVFWQQSLSFRERQAEANAAYNAKLEKLSSQVEQLSSVLSAKETKDALQDMRLDLLDRSLLRMDSSAITSRQQMPRLVPQHRRNSGTGE